MLCFKSIFEGKVKRTQQRAPFFIGACGRGARNVQTPQRIDLVVLNFRDNDLLGYAHRKIAATIERLRADTAEIANTWDRNADKAVEKLIHALAAQRYFAADGPAFANFESSDR